MKSEIITLIIGTVLGATIAFCYGLLDKKIEFKKEKNNAMICLKIELTRINTKGHLCLLCQPQHIPEFSKLVLC